MFESFTDTLTQPVMFDIPLWVFLVIIGMVFVIMSLLNKKEKEFKETDLKKEVRKDIKNYINSYNEPATKNTFLMLGYKEIGLIKKVSFANWKIGRFNFRQKRTSKKIGIMSKAEYDKIKNEKPKLKEADSYIFEIYTGRGILRKIKYTLGLYSKYYVVEKDKITKAGNIYDINSHSAFSEFLGITIFSRETQSIIEDISYKIMRERELKEMVDFTRRAIYLQERGASLGQRGEIIKAINKSNKNKTEGITEDL